MLFLNILAAFLGFLISLMNFAMAATWLAQLIKAKPWERKD